MKRNLMVLSVVMLLLVLSNSSWATCPEDTIDLGICDTLHVVPFPTTDTCIIYAYPNADPPHTETICINNPGSHFPCFLYVNLLVTHDSNSFWWHNDYPNPGDSNLVRDSISAITVPLGWTRTNKAKYCSLSTYWNENTVIDDPEEPGYPYPRRIWRNFPPLGSDSINLMGKLQWNTMIVELCSDSCLSGSDLTPPHVFIALNAGTKKKWFQQKDTLLATLTFRIQDTMHVCIDTTFWPPSPMHLQFTRYDAPPYIPRDNLPICIWVGPPPRIVVTSPNGGEAWFVDSTYDITWFSEDFTGDNVKLEFSTDAGVNWIPIITSTPNDGVHPWIIPDSISDSCRVRVSDAEDGDPYDISDGNFTITPTDFAPAVSYSAGECPISVFCADLDGDGDLDLAVVNVESDNVSILTNNGDGTFQSAVNYGVGDHPMSVFCADLDGDGDPDLAVANEFSDSVSILKNNGDGTFESAVNYGAGEGPSSVFCADLDGDGDLDLVNESANSVSTLKNNGDGTFQSAVNYGAGDGPSSVFCADLDGDRDLDLAVANYLSDNVSILKNNGNGIFQSAISYGTGDGPSSVFCADLDGDGDLDIAAGNWDSDSISILRNNGDGSFQSAVNYRVGDQPISVFCADLDGEGDLDLAVANRGSGNVSILKNNGDGTFQSLVNYGAGINPWSVFCADLDGDGDVDLAVAYSIIGNVSILKNLTQIPANQPPWAFSLITPEDQDTVFGTATFKWHIPYDPNFGDQMRYDLYISTSPGFEPVYTTVDSNLPVSKFTTAMDSGTYYWKVKAKDNWGAVTWSTETWSLVSRYLTDTLTIIAFSPVDLIVTDPVGDSIGIGFNTIPNATYDTTQDYNGDEDLDDIITIPDRLVGEYLIEVVTEPGQGGVYSLGIRIDGTYMAMLATDEPCPSPGEVDTVSYNAPWFMRGDADGDWWINAVDVVYLINYLYISGPAPEHLEAGDVNCDGTINAADVVYLINYLFISGPPPCG